MGGYFLRITLIVNYLSDIFKVFMNYFILNLQVQNLGYDFIVYFSKHNLREYIFFTINKEFRMNWVIFKISVLIDFFNYLLILHKVYVLTRDYKCYNFVKYLVSIIITILLHFSQNFHLVFA